MICFFVIESRGIMKINIINGVNKMNIDTLNIPLPEDLMKLKWNGQFTLLKEMIDLRIQKDIPSLLKERLLLEKEIIERLPRDFTYTKEEAIILCQNKLYDFTEKEFEDLFKDNAFEFLFVEGIMKFKDDFFENLIKTRPIYQKRLKKPIQEKENRDEIIQHIIDQKDVKYKIHVKVAMKIKPEYEKLGKVVRVWLPIPIEYAQVEDVKILNVSSNKAIINDNNVDQRSVYFEEELKHNQEFFVEYEFINHIRYQKLDSSIVKESHMKEYLDEQEPHILFTPYLKSLAHEIIGDETNQLIKAKKIYDYVTTHIPYSFVRSYITLPNISEYMATGLKGDCGVYAVLFITLCRIAGIPATWQSGLYCTPQTIGNHDWSRFYIEPYGWLFCDCSFGGSGFRNHSELQREFYFGHLDPFRIPSARAFQKDLVPAKTSTRRDPYDHQTGEIEYIDSYIDEKEYEMHQEIIEVKEM